MNFENLEDLLHDTAQFAALAQDPGDMIEHGESVETKVCLKLGNDHTFF
jgi:hypothetical protein